MIPVEENIHSCHKKVKEKRRGENILLRAEPLTSSKKLRRLARFIRTSVRLTRTKVRSNCALRKPLGILYHSSRVKCSTADLLDKTIRY